MQIHTTIKDIRRRQTNPQREAGEGLTEANWKRHEKTTDKPTDTSRKRYEKTTDKPTDTNIKRHAKTTYRYVDLFGLRCYNINFNLLLYTYIFTVLSRLLLDYFIKHNKWTAYFVLATFLGQSKTENLNQTLSVPFLWCVMLKVGHRQFLPPLS